MKNKQLQSMRGFTLIWIGQLASLVGTSMTRFAITIWAFAETGSATVLALTALFNFAPIVLLSPIAGALVDRWNRKLVLMISDFVAGLTTIVFLFLFMTGQLEIWHLYVIGALASSFEAFQFPAFAAAITMMLTKEQYARASGMLSVAQSAAGIGAPILAGVLLGFADLGLILMVDIATFILAVIAIVAVHIPQPAKTADGQAGKSNLWQESLYGFVYIWERPSLFGMQMMFLVANFFMGVGFILAPPSILATTDNNEVILGTVQSFAGVGGLLGGLLMSFWGGPKNRVHGILIGMIVAALGGHLVFGLGRGVLMWSIGTFVTAFCIPILNGSNQALWQAKVAPDVQGRVFATRRLLAQITFPLAMVISGPLADRIFEPAQATADSPMAQIFAPIVGVGPGSGMSLMIVCASLGAALAAATGYLIPAVREIETRQPDFEPVAAD